MLNVSYTEDMPFASLHIFKCAPLAGLTETPGFIVGYSDAEFSVLIGQKDNLFFRKVFLVHYSIQTLLFP